MTKRVIFDLFSPTSTRNFLESLYITTTLRMQESWVKWRIVSYLRFLPTLTWQWRDDESLNCMAWMKIFFFFLKCWGHLHFCNRDRHKTPPSPSYLLRSRSTFCQLLHLVCAFRIPRVEWGECCTFFRNCHSRWKKKLKLKWLFLDHF